MELDEALAQIAEIRARIASSSTFRGYRSITVGFSGLLAFVGGLVQSSWIPDPQHRIGHFVTLWIGIAVLSLFTTAVEMVVRNRRIAQPVARRLTSLAVEQFSPCIAAGALLTYVLVAFAPEACWMLPGLWSVLFSMGIFASSRLVTRSAAWVAGYYLVAGIFCLAFGRDDAALSPWSMIGTFGVGQLIAACILYWTVERLDVR